MNNTVLLTIGRLPKALDFARGFHDAGWRVVVADPFRLHLTKVSRSVSKTYVTPPPATEPVAYLETLKTIIATENVTVVVPVSEETMFVTALKPTLPAHVLLFSMPQATVLSLHDKQRFIDIAKAFDLRVPQTYRLGDPAAEVLAQKSDVVLKPIHSCSGRGVEVRSAATPLPSVSSGAAMLVQQRIKGALYSTFSIAHGGRTLTTVIYRAAVISGTVAVCFERISEHAGIDNWVERFIQGTDYTGFISFDLIVDDEDQTFAIECNPRATSGVHFLRTEDIAAAILSPDFAHPPRFKDDRFLQQFYPCLTETQASLFRKGPFRQNLHHLLHAPDVTWRWSDPLPLLLMPLTASQIMWRAFIHGEPFGEASTHDITWTSANA